FAQPNEFLSVINPSGRVFILDPRVVRLGKDRAHFASFRITEHYAVGVLQPVELLQDDLGGVGRPTHPGEVMIARIARHAEPARLASKRADYAYTRGRILFAGLRVRDRNRPR